MTIWRTSDTVPIATKLPRDVVRLVRKAAKRDGLPVKLWGERAIERGVRALTADLDLKPRRARAGNGTAWRVHPRTKQLAQINAAMLNVDMKTYLCAVLEQAVRERAG